MADTQVSFVRNPRVRAAVGVILLAVIAFFAWTAVTAGRESTDDAQVDARITAVAARVSGTVTGVAVDDNQTVDAGAVLVELDPRDYQVAVD
jgi:membrane fusion protein (multidrug efflux system)